MKKKALLLTSLIFTSFILFSQLRLDVDGEAWIHNNLRIGNDSDDNIFIGKDAGKNTLVGDFDKGQRNLFLGNSSGFSNTDGNYNTFLGNLSGQFNEIGFNNTFIGYSAGYNNKTAKENTFIGVQSGFNNDGDANTFLGYNSGNMNTSGSNNTLIGTRSGHGVTDGINNVLIGVNAGYYTGSSWNNTIIGTSAGSADGLKGNNVIIGSLAGMNNTGLKNIFIGSAAGMNALGSHKLYIENSESDSPLIYGEFDNDKLQINGSLHITEFARLIPGSAPTTPEKGTMYYDSSDDKVKVWTGSSWENLFFTSSQAESSFQQPTNSPCNTLCQEDNQKLKVRVELLEEKLQKYENMENKLERMEQLISQLSKSPNVIQKIELSKLARLEQNTPNPFHGNTKIKYFLPEDSKNASIKIYDVTGRVVKNVEIENQGEGEIEVQISEFSKGIYHYSLEIDGQIIDTKKMSSIK